VAISTWYGGAGPGLLATAFAGSGERLLFLRCSRRHGRFRLDDALRLGVFPDRRSAHEFPDAFSTKLPRTLSRRRTTSWRIAYASEPGNWNCRPYKVIESEERFRILMEGSRGTTPFSMLDTEGLVVSWNSGSERIYGYKQAEVCGSSYTVFFSPDDQQLNKPTEQLHRAIDASRTRMKGWRIRKDGSRFWANVIITPPSR